MDASAFEPRRFSDLPGWADADHAPAFLAFRLSAPRLLGRDVETGALGVPADTFLDAAAAAIAPGTPHPRSFFEDHFVPALIRPGGPGSQGFATGYYEPELDASNVRTAAFTTPLHARPADLVEVDDTNRPRGWPRDVLFARLLTDGTLAEHPDRGAIAAGALDGQGLEIAWLRDPVDAFFVHVQGSARLRMADGSAVRVGYAGKSGHTYSSIGRILVEEGELTLAEADMAGLRRWLADHPDRMQALLERNRSYIFFRARPVDAEAPGPVGAAGLPLTPLGSIALDHTLHTYGLPVFLDAPGLSIDGAPFRQLLVAQDTGSAIRGPARGDIFVGSGEAAGRLAGTIRHPAEFIALLPKPLASRLAR